MRLRFTDVTAGWTAVAAVSGIDLDVAPQTIVALVGPNGSGKSTLLRTVYRALRPRAGHLVLGEDDLWAVPAREVARRVGVLPQDESAGFDFTAEQAVALGRAPHLGIFDRLRAEDHEIVRSVLEQVGCSELARRTISTLSGGERQRVLLARALAQQPRLLVLDEPTNHLDPRHQMDVLGLVRDMGTTVLAALHDLDLAASYSDHVAVLSHGRIVTVGKPREVFTPELLAAVFGVDGSLLPDPVTGRPRLLLRPLRNSAALNDEV